MGISVVTIIETECFYNLLLGFVFTLPDLICPCFSLLFMRSKNYVSEKNVFWFPISV